MVFWGLPEKTDWTVLLVPVGGAFPVAHMVEPGLLARSEFDSMLPHAPGCWLDQHAPSRGQLTKDPRQTTRGRYAAE